jgi:hypothetical protein
MKKTIRNKSKKQCRHKNKKRCHCSKRIRKMSGGNVNSLNFQQSPGQYYYDVNDYKGDPSDPSVVMSTRNAPNMVGGKRRRNYRKTRKMRGGKIDLLLGNGQLNNPLTSFGNVDGAFMGKSLFSGEAVLDGSVINQPAYLTYNSNSLPLV